MRRGRPTVGVGITQADGAKPHGEGGKTTAEIATYHEFGRGGQVERSFIRSWYDEAEAANTLRRDVRRAMASVLQGSSYDQALERLGLLFAGQIKRRITSRKITPDISEATKRAKGSTTVLIDEGILLSRIGHEIKR